MKYKKHRRYSIRKLHVGAGSVIIGTILLAGTPMQSVQAQEQGMPTTSSLSEQNGSGHPSDSSGKGGDAEANSSASSKDNQSPSAGTSALPAGALDTSASTSERTPSSGLGLGHQSSASSTSLLSEARSTSLTNGQNPTSKFSKQSTTVKMANGEAEEKVDGSVDYELSYDRDAKDKATIVKWAVTINKKDESWTNPRFVFAFPKGVEVQEDIESASGAFYDFKFSDFKPNNNGSYYWRADKTNLNYFTEEWNRHVSYASPDKKGVSSDQFETLLNIPIGSGIINVIKGSSTLIFKIKVPDNSDVNPFNMPLLAGINQFTGNWYRFKGEVPDKNAQNPHTPKLGEGGLTDGTAKIFPEPKPEMPVPQPPKVPEIPKKPAPTPPEQPRVTPPAPSQPKGEMIPMPTPPMKPEGRPEENRPKGEEPRVELPPAEKPRGEMKPAPIPPMKPDSSPSLPEAPKRDIPQNEQPQIEVPQPEVTPKPQDEIIPIPELPMKPDPTPPAPDKAPALPRKPEQPKGEIMPSPVLPLKPDSSAPESPKMDKPKAEKPKLGQQPEVTPKRQDEIKPLPVEPIKPSPVPSVSAQPKVEAPKVEQPRAEQPQATQSSPKAKAGAKELPNTGDGLSILPWLGSGLLGMLGVVYMRKRKK
ncbi:YSIRK-type signal peptide-containing protein [Streptococcus ruminantium]|uniref:YSIRK-type signal peptide-containing protein n=1 Tax=Streptococcus ruminantium TaxID=1917441 RepID=UPI0012DC5BA5|nr:YSIRK-type signal peptide-containing protein [Streptococcus ruminantium]